MKHKGGMKGARDWARGAMDETQGGNEAGSRGQWMKHKGGMKGAREWMKHKGGMKGARGSNG